MLTGDITLINSFENWNGGIIPSTDAAGLGYYPVTGNLVIADSEINELSVFTGDNIFEVSLSGDQLVRGAMSGSSEPTGIVYSEFDQFFYVTNDDGDRTITRYATDLETPLLVKSVIDDVPSAGDPEGVSANPANGDLYVVSGDTGQLVQVVTFDKDLNFKSSFSLADRLTDAEGIAYHEPTNHLFVVSGGQRVILEYTLEGLFVEEYDISGFEPFSQSAQGLTFAPSSSTLDSPDVLSLYIADGGRDNFEDGRIYEARIGDGGESGFPPVVSAGPDQAISLPAAAFLDGTVSDDGNPDDPGAVTIEWSQVSGPEGVTFGTPNAEDTTANFPTVGTYVLRLTASDGLFTRSDDVTVSVNITTSQITSGANDAEEDDTGRVRLTSSDLELVFDRDSNQTVGLRFEGLNIPQGAAIVDAYIQFQVDETSTDATSLVIEGEARDDSPVFESTNGNLSSRPRTSQSVAWEVAPWNSNSERGPSQQTPNLFAVVEEIVGRAGWTPGNALSFLITGTGERVAESYNGSPAGAPMLHVEFSVGNDRPTTSGIANVLADEGGPDTVVDLFAAFDDMEDADSALTYEVVANSNPTLFTNVAIDQTFGTLTLSHVPDLFGDATLTVRATDTGLPGLWVEATFQVTVAEMNDPPVLIAGMADDFNTLEDTGPMPLGLTGIDYGPGGGPEEAGQQLTYAITEVPPVGFGQVLLADGLTPVVPGPTTLETLRGLQFRPASDVSGGPMPFRYSVTDDGTEGGVDAFQTTLETINITIADVNDPPTTSGIGDVNGVEDDPPAVIDLFAAFDDLETADADFTFTVESTSNPGLFASLPIDGVLGTLTLNYAAHANGASDVTVRATDASAMPLHVETTFTVTLDDMNSPALLVAGAVDDLTIPEDNGLTSLGLSTIDYSPGGADESGQTLVYEVTALPPAGLGTVLLADGTTPLMLGPTTLETLRGLQFLAPPESHGGPFDFTWTVTDDGNTQGIPDPQVRTETIAIKVVEVNDPPVRTAGVLADLVAAEDSGISDLTLDGLAYGPGGGADEAGQTLTYSVVTVPPASFGTILLADGITPVAPGPFSLAEISGLQFRAADDAFGGPMPFTYRVTDNGMTDGAGMPESLDQTVMITLTPSNDPPVTTNFAAINLLEDASPSVLDLFATFNDVEDSDNALTYSIESNSNPGLFSATTLDPVAGTLTLAYTPELSGDAELVVRATDTGTPGLSVESTLSVSLSAVNDPPERTAGAVENLMVDEDSGTVPLGLTAVDYGPGGGADEAGQTLSYQVTQVPPAALADVVLADGVTTVTPGPYTLAEIRGMQLRLVPDANGEATFQFMVSDNGPLAQSLVQEIGITVVDTNELPTTSGIGNVLVDEDAPPIEIDLFAAFDDVETSDAELIYEVFISGDSLFSSQPVDLDTGLLTLSLAPHANGMAEITVRATDTWTPSASVETSFMVTVNAVNDAPTALAIDEVVVDEGASPTVIDLFATFDDVEDLDADLTYSIELVTNAGLFASTVIDETAGTLTLAYADEMNGVSQLTLRATDTATPALSVDTILQVNVIDVNDVPVRVAGQVANLDVAEDSGLATLGLAGVAYSPGNSLNEAGQTLTYAVTQVPDAALGEVVLADGATVVTPGPYTLTEIQGLQFRTLANASGGPTTFQFTVTDDGLNPQTLVETQTIHVTEVNDPPVRTTGTLQPISVPPGAGATPLGFAALQFSPGGGTDELGQTLTYTVTQVPSPGLGEIVLADGATVVSPGVYTLAEVQGMQFRAAAGAPGGIDQFRLLVTDNGTTDSVAAPASIEETLDILVVQGETIEQRVATFVDDAEEGPSGRVKVGSNDLGIVFDDGGDQTVGLRFRNLAIPQGAQILRAYVQFRADESDSGPASFTIRGEAADDAFVFTSLNGSLSSRATTTASAAWTPDAWVAGQSGPAQQTTDLANVIQEVVDRDGWQSGNALALLITGAGERVALSQDASPLFAPLLHVEYIELDDANTAPQTTGIDNVSVAQNSPNSVIDLFAAFSDQQDADNELSYTVTQNTNPGLFDAVQVNGATGTLSLDYAANTVGTAQITVRATDQGTPALFAQTTFTVTVSEGNDLIIIESRITSSTDDVEQRVAGNMRLFSNDLGLTFDNNEHQTIGLRFNDLNIPAGATIVNAYVQFQADEADSTPTSLTIQGQAADNATTFVAQLRNLTDRPRTTAAVPWSPAPWTRVGEAGIDQQTPDVSSIVQEIVDRPGWSAGNSLVLVITGTGERVAESYDGQPNAAPKLRIEYTTGGAIVTPPVANGIDDVNVAPDAADVQINLNAAFDSVITPDEQLVFSIEANTSPGLFNTTTIANGTLTLDFDASALGRAELTVRATDPALAAAFAETTFAVTISGGSIVVESRVSASTDDVEQRVAGNMRLFSNDLGLTFDNGEHQTIGLRFNDLNIPAGATILNAYVQFQADEADSTPTSLTIQGQAADNATTFLAQLHDLTDRPRTTAAVPWSPAPWTRVGEAGIDQQTPDVSSIVQEIVDRPGWSANNSLVLIVTGTGERVAESYDGLPGAVPKLFVEYAVEPLRAVATTLPGDDLPMVSAAELTSIVQASITRLTQVLGPEVTTPLSTATVELADLPGDLLGLAAGTTIQIDRDAAGWGWFVDETPLDDHEFVAGAGGPNASERVDLLSAVMHEMAHLLGFRHQEETGFLSETLSPGTRVLPSADAEHTHETSADAWFDELGRG